MPSQSSASVSVSRKGRRPGTNKTRQAILEAARARFARDGFTATTVRKIAVDAGVDAALVIRFFGSKDALFAAALSIPASALTRMTDAFVGPEEGLGVRVTRAYLEVWEGDPHESEPLLAMLRSAVSNEQAASQLREFIQARLLEALTPGSRAGDDALLRAGLASSMLVGVIVGRCVVGVETLVNQDRETIVERVAPAIQAVLAGPVVSSEFLGPE